MWIKEPSATLSTSLSQKVNFLFQSGKTYIMDNHLCAGWAWMNHLDISNSHNLFHVDRHYDLSCFEDAVNECIVVKGVELNKLTFEEYTELKVEIESVTDSELKLFTWDTYIGNISQVYPNFFGETYFACHESGDRIEDLISNEPTFELLPDNISYWINRDHQKKWIFNLDLDYFFMEIGENTIQAFTDDYIRAVALSIKRAQENIDVLTICLSPECCGGWGNALRINKIVCEILDIDFDLSGFEIIAY